MGRGEIRARKHQFLANIVSYFNEKWLIAKVIWCLNMMSSFVQDELLLSQTNLIGICQDDMNGFYFTLPFSLEHFVTYMFKTNHFLSVNSGLWFLQPAGFL